MSPTSVEIYDPKKRNEIVQSFLKNRKEHKFKNLEERSNLENVEDHRIEVFKPILESNKLLQEEIIDEKNKIVQTLNLFRPSIPSIQGTLQILAPQTPKQFQATPRSQSPCIKVSNLIATYLQDPRDKSTAGYSIRYSSEGKKGYTIGNKEVTFDDNTLAINDEEYEASEGLMELLTKKSPDLIKISQVDKQNYKEILLASDALYQGFNKFSKKYNSDSSNKWKFIKENYFVPKGQATESSVAKPLQQSSQSVNNSQTSGSAIVNSPTIILPIQRISEPVILPPKINALMDSLRLSIGSYQAGNKGEFNKIHAILDGLIRRKKIKKKDLPSIYLGIGL